MSTGTYLSVNLTRKQIEFMLQLEDHELDIFTLEEIQHSLGDEAGDLHALLENLADKRILSRIERGNKRGSL